MHYPFVTRTAIVATTLLLLTASLSAAADGSRAYFTNSQVKHGAAVFSNHCAKCHGSQMQGKTGPALAGEDFRESVSYSKMSGKQLFDFISSQMPYDAPGSLTDKQYRWVMAYILKQNGFPAGGQPLTHASLDKVKLLPFPSHD